MKIPVAPLPLALLAVLAASCTSLRGPDPDNLGRHAFKVTTESREAQKHFNRGLTLAYAFSHKAAEDEFRQAAADDPQLAMAWWGVALVNGPHINFPLVPPDKAKIAWEAMTKAKALAASSSPLEQELIAALGKRYAWPQPENRAPLDQAYAAAMRDAAKSHPDNADVLTLYAEAMMDLRPWDLWTLGGVPQPGTEEIVSTLEAALKLNPRHPGANHLYIHAVEASPNPGRALAAADRLGGLVPASGHLVHMPSHIYARVGRWTDAANSNVKAMRADVAYRARHPRPGFYALYMAHNTHFFAFTAMMQGRSEEAITHARKMVAEIPEDFLKEFGPVVDGYTIFVSEVLMRFGRWDELLAEPPPPAGLPLASALYHYTRATAFAALGRKDEALREKASFKTAAARVPSSSTFGNNPAASILAIAGLSLDGEMAARSNHFDEAIAALRGAIYLEDRLRYDEPPDWIQPVRHTLGVVQLRAGKFADAEATYREDLAKYPENGWSLYGLSRALRLQGKDSEAAKVERRFRRAWSRADFELTSTCFCQPGV